MKKFLVVLLACALIFGFATTALAADTQITEFNDIADQALPARNAIMKLAVLGVIEGNEGIGGAFRPTDNLTRAEFAKIVCYLTDNVKLAESLSSVGSRFTDVSTGNWYTGWVNAAAQSGYYVGDPGGTFRPNANITMQEVVTVALRCAGYTDKLGNSTGNTTWPGNYITKAMNVGILDNVTFVGSSPATRSDMAIICEEVLGINMVVHISNDIAYALSLASGEVDPDGFSEIYYISNETNGVKQEETILHKAFKGVYHDVQVQPAYVETRGVNNNAIDFDETAGWYYEDFTTGELALRADRQFYPNDKTFKDWGYYDNNNDWVGYTYSQGEALASTYYITNDYGLTDLSGMQAQITVIDKEEICFVEVVSSKVDAGSIYWEGGNIMADGKSFRPSDQMDVNNRITSTDARYGIVDYTEGVYFLDATGGSNDDHIQAFAGAETDDNDFGGRLYLDAKGRVYAVKNYDAYDGVVFGIFEKIDSNQVEWKDENSKVAAKPGGADKFNKTETNKNYTLYRDGELAKFEDLDENDLVYYLEGSNFSTGAPFFWASSPKEGDMTKQTNTAVTVGGTAYNVDEDPYNTGMLFHLSDDGGETFMAFNIALPPYQIESFGESEYAMAYNFNKLAYVNSNLTNQKVIGVVTKIKPATGFSNSSGLDNKRYEEITIYNAEGKEVTYKFTSDFRDGYTWFVYNTGRYPDTNWNVSSSGSTKWASSQSSPFKGVEGALSTPLKDGDIVQLIVDKNDNVKKLANYASFDPGTAKGEVLTSKERLNITGNGSVGSYVLDKDCVVFEVSTDDSDYDDTSIVSVASVLASDFNAGKITAFDIKNNSNVAALYIIRSVSVAKYGILTQVAYDNDGWILTINGKEMRADTPATLSFMGNSYDFKTRVRAVIAYQVVAGEVRVVRLVANRGNLELPLIDSGDGTVSDTFGVDGVVTGTNSSNGSVTITKDGKSTIVYTKDAYMYNFPLPDGYEAVTNINDMKGKYVVAYYDKNFDATCIAVISNEETFSPTGGFTAQTDDTINNNAATLGLIGTSVSTSDAKVATAAIVSGKIAITSVGTGTATITVTLGANSATIEVSVNSKGAVTIDKVTPYFTAGTDIVTAGTMNLGVLRSLSSSDSAVATAEINATSDGITITAKGVGTATITVTDFAGNTAKVTVTVTPTTITTSTLPHTTGSAILMNDLGACTDLTDAPVIGAAAGTPVIATKGGVYNATATNGWTAGVDAGGVYDDDEATYEIVLTAAGVLTFYGTDISGTALKAKFPLASDVTATVSTNVNVGDTLTIEITYTVSSVKVNMADLTTAGFTDLAMAPYDGANPAAFVPTIDDGTGYTGTGRWTSGTISGGTKFAAAGGNAVYAITLTADTDYTFTGTDITAALLAAEFTEGTPTINVTVGGNPSGKTLTITLTYTIVQ